MPRVREVWEHDGPTEEVFTTARRVAPGATEPTVGAQYKGVKLLAVGNPKLISREEIPRHCETCDLDHEDPQPAACIAALKAEVERQRMAARLYAGAAMGRRAIWDAP